MQQFETETNPVPTPPGYTPQEYGEVVRKAEEIRREREGRLSTDQLVESAAEVGIREEDIREAERRLREEKQQQAQRKSKMTMIGGGVAVVLALFSIFSYNGLNGSRLEATKAQADLQATLQRRADLAEQLLPVARAGAGQEREVAAQIASARQGLQSGDLNQASSQLRQGLVRLTEAAQQDPTFRASENYRTLQVQIEGSENRVAEYRKRYNRAVTDYNQAASTFPTNLVRPILGFPGELKPFEASGSGTALPSF